MSKKETTKPNVKETCEKILELTDLETLVFLTLCKANDLIDPRKSDFYGMSKEYKDDVMTLYNSLTDFSERHYAEGIYEE